MARTKQPDSSQGDMFSNNAVQTSEMFSHSRISTFNNCALNYKFRYVDKLPSEDEGLEAFMGQRVHEALEFLYQGVQRGQTPLLDEVLDYFEKRWKDTDSPKVVPRKRGSSKATAILDSRKQIEDYYQAHEPFSQGQILLLEGRIKFYLGQEERVPFQSILDRLMKAEDGALEIHDYKTGRRMPTQQNLDKDKQLSLYEIAVREKFGHDGEIRLVWHYLAHRKVLLSHRSSSQLEDAETQTLAAVHKVIEARQKRLFPPGPGPLCYYCSYRRACIHDYAERGEHHPILSG